MCFIWVVSTVRFNAQHVYLNSFFLNGCHNHCNSRVLQLEFIMMLLLAGLFELLYFLIVVQGLNIHKAPDMLWVLGHTHRNLNCLVFLKL